MLFLYEYIKYDMTINTTNAINIIQTYTPSSSSMNTINMNTSYNEYNKYNTLLSLYVCTYPNKSFSANFSISLYMAGGNFDSKRGICYVMGDM